jgi:hypothetical protein
MEFRDFGHNITMPGRFLGIFLVDEKFKGLSNKPLLARF